MSARARAAALLLFVIGMAAAADVLGVRSVVPLLLAWVGAHGPLAWAAFILAYVIAAVAVVPGWPLTLGAGFLFGLPLGVAVVSAGSVLGAACAFVVGRFLARGWVAARIGRLPRFAALDQATRRSGFLIVLLVRLSPLFPFNVINYALGLTDVRFRDYFFASWIGMLPATVVYVYVGTVAKSVTQLAGGAGGTWPGRALLMLGFGATVALTVLITRKATSALSTHLQTDGSGR